MDWLDESMEEVSARITAALDCPAANDEDMMIHMLWLLNEMTAVVKPHHLQPDELIALLAVLMKPHARVLTLTRTPPLLPVLHVVADPAANHC